MRVLLFISGIYLISTSILFIVVYTNLISMGYSLKEYLLFILKRYEVLSIIPGIIMTGLSIKKRSIKRNI